MPGKLYIAAGPFDVCAAKAGIASIAALATPVLQGDTVSHTQTVFDSEVESIAPITARVHVYPRAEGC